VSAHFRKRRAAGVGGRVRSQLRRFAAARHFPRSPEMVHPRWRGRGTAAAGRAAKLPLRGPRKKKRERRCHALMRRIRTRTHLGRERRKLGTADGVC
jgi:hypothetical protein